MSDVKSVSVIGAGGHAKVVISTLRAAGYTVKAVFDDDPGKLGTILSGVMVQGPIAEFPGDRRGVIAVGDNDNREIISRLFKTVEWVTVVHPQASVDPSVKLGPGTVVFAGSVIQADSVIGSHVIINTGATVDHDCVIGDYSHVAPGAHLAGGNLVGKAVLLGIGSVVVPGRQIGDRAVIGAGGVVLKDLAAGVTAFGVPATPGKTRTD